jgi:hypothetical protein
LFNLIPDFFNRLSCFSTRRYLSFFFDYFTPTRLVIYPIVNLFGLSCATATTNEKAQRAVPAATRELVRIYSCLHRS